MKVECVLFLGGLPRDIAHGMHIGVSSRVYLCLVPMERVDSAPII